MIINKAHVSIVGLFIFVGLLVAVYYVVTQKESQNFSVLAPQNQDGKNQNANTELKEIPIQNKLTREDILATNWPFPQIDSVKQIYGVYDGYRIQKNTNEVVITDQNGAGSVMYKKLTDEDVLDRDIVALAYNYHTKKLYILTNDSTGQFWWLFENDTTLESKPKEITSGESIVIQTFRFSPDYTTLSFMSYTADKQTQEIIKAYFHIINLTDPTRSITFEQPGNIKKYISEHDLTPQQAIKVKNVIGAYRLINNSVEFTSYYAEGTEYRGYTQISDKELWSYNSETDKMTLLKTVPLK